MVIRIKITLEQEEYSGLLKSALSEMRSPQEQLRFILIRHLKRARLLPNTNSQIQMIKELKPLSQKKESTGAL